MSEQNAPVRVLHILPGNEKQDYGGTESFLYEYYKHMNRDSVIFDFVFCLDNSLKLRENDPIFENSRFIPLQTLRKRKNGLPHWFATVKAIRKIAREGKYPCAHIQTGVPLVQFFATLALTGLHIPLRVSHSHCTHPPEKTPFPELIRMAVRPVVNAGNDFLFACSRAAGEDLFGKRATRSHKFRVIPNAIDAQAFRYNPSVRENVREAEGLSDTCKVIGHVGRIAKEKNPLFIVDVFAAFHELEPDSVLWMVGGGELRDEVEKRVREYGLTSCVKLWGARRDVPKLLQGMDLFLFPSSNEGLGISAIEAQAAGLPTVVSDAVPEECGITNLFRQLPLRESASFWAEQIADILRTTGRRNTCEEIVKAGYEISAAAAKLENFYLSYTQRAKGK